MKTKDKVKVDFIYLSPLSQPFLFSKWLQNTKCYAHFTLYICFESVYVMDFNNINEYQIPVFVFCARDMVENSHVYIL